MQSCVKDAAGDGLKAEGRQREGRAPGHYMNQLCLCVQFSRRCSLISLTAGCSVIQPHSQLLFENFTFFEISFSPIEKSSFLIRSVGVGFF